jgi:hypothetical protein
MAPLFGRNRTKILRRLALRATDDKPRSLRTENVDYAEPLDLADSVLRSFPIGFEVISPPISLEPLAGASRNRKFADSLLEEAVSSELVSEVGFPAPVEKAGFQGFCG